MSATFHTKNMSLPQFCENDIPQWLGDVNPAFKAIDDHAGKADEGIENATELAQKGIDDAATAQAVADTANQRSLENKTNIDTLTAKTTNLDARLTTAEGNIATNTGNITTNAANIAENAAKIAAQETKLSEHDTRIGTLETASGNQETEIEQIKTKDAQQDAEIEQNKQQLTVLQANALTLNPANRIMRNGADVNRIVFPSESVIEGERLAVKGIETPQDDGDATPKSYVDTLVQTANETIATLTSQVADLTSRVAALEGKTASEVAISEDGTLMNKGEPVPVLRVANGYYAGSILLVADDNNNFSINGNPT